MDTRRNITVPAVIVMFGAIGLGVLRYFASDPTTPNHILGCLAFAAPFFIGGLVAVVGDQRDHLLFVVAAGVGLFPISLVSIVMWPILIPAAILVWQGSLGISNPNVTEVLTSAAIVTGLCGTFAMLLFHQDPATWQTADGPASSSNIITAGEVLVTFTALLAILVAAVTVPVNNHRQLRRVIQSHDS